MKLNKNNKRTPEIPRQELNLQNLSRKVQSDGDLRAAQLYVVIFPL